jgi:hypothetical protein
VGGRQASGTLRGCLGRRRLLVHVRECSFVNNVTVLFVPLHVFVWLSRCALHLYSAPAAALAGGKACQVHTGYRLTARCSSTLLGRG